MTNCESSSAHIEASRMVGRVGALAVALGVGAVWFSGGVASADTSSDSGSVRATHSRGADDSSAPSSSTVRSARAHRGSAGAAASAGPARNNRPAAAASRRAAASSAPQAAEDVTPTEEPTEAVVQSPAPVAVAAVEPAPEASVVEAVDPTVDDVAVPEVAPASDEVSAVATAGTDTVDPTADDNPTGQIDSPLSWAVAAFTRRAGAPGAAAVADPTYNIGACTQQSQSCTYILGPSGVPIPTKSYANTVMKYYILPNSAQQDTTAQLVFTPEGAYPVTGIKVLPLTISVQQGQTILENTIETLQPGPMEGDVPVTIFGYSQSAIISSLLQRDLDTEIGLLPGLDRNQLRFVTVGQEMSPDGGWFARFPGLNTPSLGQFWFGSTPEDSYPTTNYTLEYDGFADSPRYAGNLLSSLNAAFGILFVHINYANENYFANTYGTTLGSLDPLMGIEGPGVACNDGSPTCTELPTTSPDQKYYFIQTPHLPLLTPLRAIPFIGNPLANLVEPVLKVIVDLGYADPAHGFTSTTQPPANVATPFGLLLTNLTGPLIKETASKLIAGVGQGVRDFIGSFSGGGGGGGGGMNLPTLKQLLAVAAQWVVRFPAYVSNAASALYGTLLATADFINAGLTSLPAYAGTLFVDGIKQAFQGLNGLPPGGFTQFIEGLVNAVGRPFAAIGGLAAAIAVIQTTVWLEGIVAALTGCGPGATTAGLCVIPGL